MIEAVFDANVLVAGIVGTRFEQSTPGELIRRWLRGDFTLALSAYLLDEVERALTEPYFQARLTATQMDRSLAVLRRRARVVALGVTVEGVASHAEDDPVIATALSAGAAYLVTGDKELRAIGGYGGVTFLTPREFLDLLDREQTAVP